MSEGDKLKSFLMLNIDRADRRTRGAMKRAARGMSRFGRSEFDRISKNRKTSRGWVYRVRCERGNGSTLTFTLSTASSRAPADAFGIFPTTDTQGARVPVGYISPDADRVAVPRGFIWHGHLMERRAGAARLPVDRLMIRVNSAGKLREAGASVLDAMRAHYSERFKDELKKGRK